MGCKLCATPIEVNHGLKGNDNERLIDVGRYRRLMGCLIYLSSTKRNIAYAVTVISQFMHTRTQVHMEAAYRVLMYLKGCLEKGILLKKHDHQKVVVVAYTDADWAGSLTDMRSTSGYCSFVWDNLVTWRSKKKNQWWLG